jgi:hypothetical protein
MSFLVKAPFLQEFCSRPMQQLLEAADLLAGETAWGCLGPPKTGKNHWLVENILVGG